MGSPGDPGKDPLKTTFLGISITFGIGGGGGIANRLLTACYSLYSKKMSIESKCHQSTKEMGFYETWTAYHSVVILVVNALPTLQSMKSLGFP